MVKTIPLIFDIWPYKNFFYIQDYLFIDSKPHLKHELGIIKGEPTNNKPPRPINTCSQSRASVILCYGFC